MSDTPPAINPVKIPLYVFQSSGGSGYKIGIKVSFDNKTFQMYEFDTGGSGFWAAGNANWWSQYSTPQPDPGPQTIQYSSGIQYIANPVVTQIYFENVPAPLTAQVARIFQATRGGDISNQDQQFDVDWQNALTQPSPKPPLWGQFFGDFGMGLAPFVNQTSGDTVFFAVLPQLTQPLCDGFIIDLGPYPANNAAGAGGWVQEGFIQIGLAPGDTAQFPNQFKMQPATNLDAQDPVFPNSGIPTYAEKLVQGSLTLSPPSFCFEDQTGIVFDTGAPTIELHTGTDQITVANLNPYLNQPLSANSNGNSTSNVKEGMSFLLTAPLQNPGPDSSDVLIGITAEDTDGLNLAGATTLNIQGTEGYVNTGLVPFFNGPVLYDLKQGIIGFQGAPKSL